jgi:hypothetical protein
MLEIDIAILMTSDYFSKWVAAVPLPTKEAVGVVNELFKVYNYIHVFIKLFI